MFRGSAFDREPIRVHDIIWTDGTPMPVDVLRWRLLLTASKPLKSICKPYPTQVDSYLLACLLRYAVSKPICSRSGGGEEKVEGGELASSKFHLTDVWKLNDGVIIAVTYSAQVLLQIVIVCNIGTSIIYLHTKFHMLSYIHSSFVTIRPQG
jgi:hypothetical protein